MAALSKKNIVRLYCRQAGRGPTNCSIKHLHFPKETPTKEWWLQLHRREKDTLPKMHETTRHKRKQIIQRLISNSSATKVSVFHSKIIVMRSPPCSNNNKVAPTCFANEASRYILDRFNGPGNWWGWLGGVNYAIVPSPFRPRVGVEPLTWGCRYGEVGV